MAQNKTTATKSSVEGYLKKISNAKRRADCEALAALMAKATKQPATMWGTSIVGFGSYHYVYESGREGDMCLVGFASRAADIALYGLHAAKNAEALIAKLGAVKSGKGCVYIKSMADIDTGVLAKLVASAAVEKKKAHA